MEINPLTTDFSLGRQCFVFLYNYSLGPSQSANQLISVSHRKQALALDNLFCSVPEVEGWVWAGLWQVAGVPPPSDLNSICPHAKGMNASEGE